MITKIDTKGKLNYFQIVMVFILLNPVIDLFTSIMKTKFGVELSIGIIIRGLFLAFTVLYMIFKHKYHPSFKKITWIYLCGTLLCSIIFIINVYNVEGMSSVISETKDLIKVFYFPTMLVAIINGMYEVEDQIDISIVKENGIFYVMVMIIAQITRTQAKAYSYGAGHVGWFYAGNEVGAIFGILFPIVLLCIFEKWKRGIALKVIVTSIFIYVMFQLGTKVPALSVFFTLAVVIIQYIIKYFSCNRQKRELLKIIGCMMLLIIAFIIFQYSPLKTNLNNHSQWFENKKENIVQSYTDGQGTAKEKFTNEENKNEENSNSQVVNGNNQEKSNNADINNEVSTNQSNHVNSNESIIANKESEDNSKIQISEKNAKILSLIFSSRDRFALARINQFKDANITEKLFGMGYLTMDQSGNIVNNMTEIDYLDIWFSYGILGFIFYMIPIIYIIIYIMKNFFCKFRDNIIKTDIILYFISIFLGLGIAFFAGHVLNAPAVSIYLAIELMFLYYKIDKDKVSTDSCDKFSSVRKFNTVILIIVTVCQFI